MSKGMGNLGALLPSTVDYRALRTSWKSDVVAGITVGIVALPLALAFGVSSGVGAEAGLITAIVAGIVAAVFGGSNVQVSGPTGAMVVVLAPIVATHGAGSVLVVGILAGAILVVAGVLRLGRTVSYIPWPVIEGFTVGIGVIIFLQQVPSAVGVSGEGHHTNSIIAAFQSITEAEAKKALYSVMVVIAVAVIMLVLSRLNGWIPASFIAIVAVSVVAALFRLPLETIGELPHSLPAPHLPELSFTLVYALMGPAFAVAALAAIESLLSARVAGSMADTGPFNADRELVGQGLASLASGVFGGMPATGAIARTAVNVRSGAKTRVSAIVHSLSLLAVVYLAATVVSHIPLAALAGVLMVTAGKMVSVATIKEVTKTSRPDAAVFILTIIVTVTFDLVIAVGIGIAAAASFALRALSRASGIHRQELRGEPQPGDEKIALFRLEGSLFFGAAEGILERIERYEGIEVVILRLSQLQLVDATGARTLTELVNVLERKGITVLIKGIRKEHLRIFQRVGVVNSLRHVNHLFTELPPAVEHARSHVRRSTTGAMY
jgi:SulP family sulfate permease